MLTEVNGGDYADRKLPFIWYNLSAGEAARLLLLGVCKPLSLVSELVAPIASCNVVLFPGRAYGSVKRFLARWHTISLETVTDDFSANVKVLSADVSDMDDLPLYLELQVVWIQNVAFVNIQLIEPWGQSRGAFFTVKLSASHASPRVVKIGSELSLSIVGLGANLRQAKSCSHHKKRHAILLMQNW